MEPGSALDFDGESALDAALEAALSEELESDDDLAGGGSAGGDEYRSLYQPLPFRWNDDREISFSSPPPHSSHSVFGPSLMVCMYSKVFLQELQAYS